MGAEENTVEQPPQDTTSDSIDALLEEQVILPNTFLNRYKSNNHHEQPVQTDGQTSQTKQPTANSQQLIAKHPQYAARYGDIDDVKSIASAGVSLDSKNSEGRTALHMASANGHHDIVDYLIQSGVEVNVSNTEKNTPLHWACLNGHIEVVKHLVLAGAGLSLLNSHERTPIDEAISSRKMDVIDAINEATAQAELAGTRVS
ncbi:hypothetical protein OROMI_017559 [Orobanche minor]